MMRKMALTIWQNKGQALLELHICLQANSWRDVSLVYNPFSLALSVCH